MEVLQNFKFMTIVITLFVIMGVVGKNLKNIFPNINKSFLDGFLFTITIIIIIGTITIVTKGIISL